MMNLDFLKGAIVFKNGNRYTVADVDNESGKITLDSGVKFMFVTGDGRYITDFLTFDDDVLKQVNRAVEEDKSKNIRRALKASSYNINGKLVTGNIMKLKIGNAFSTETEILNRCFHKGFNGYQQGGCPLNSIYHAWFPKIATIVNGDAIPQNETDSWINYFDETGEYLFETNVNPEVTKEKKAYDGLDRITFAKYENHPYTFVGVYRRVEDPDKTIRKYKRIATEFNLENLGNRL